MSDPGSGQDIGNSDGKIVVAGRTGTTYNSSDNDFAILRMDLLHETFGAQESHVYDHRSRGRRIGA